MIERVGNGISLNDIKHCYPDIGKSHSSLFSFFPSNIIIIY